MLILVLEDISEREIPFFSRSDNKKAPSSARLVSSKGASCGGFGVVISDPSWGGVSLWFFKIDVNLNILHRGVVRGLF
jgi:hypothetical protein